MQANAVLDRSERAFAIAAGVAAIATLFYLLMANDFRMTYVSGIWTALAIDLKDGIFYRPIESDLGYGGTRYFPLHILLQSTLTRWTHDPFAAGHLIAAGSAVLMAIAVIRLLKGWGVPRSSALAAVALIFVGDTVMHAVTEIKGDLLPLTLALWAIVIVDGNERSRNTMWIFAGSLLALAMVTKPTSLMYTGAVCLHFLMQRQLRSAVVVAVTALAVSGGLLLLVNQLSGHAFGLNVAEFANAGGGFATFADGARNFLRYAYSPIDPALIVFLSAALVLVPTLRRERAPLLFCLFGVVFCGTVFVMGSPGTTKNHLIDVYVISVCVVLVGLYRSVPRLVPVGLGMASAVAVAGSVALVLHPIIGNARETAWSRQQVVAFLDREGAYRSPSHVLCFDPIIDTKSGRSPYLLDSMMFRAYLSRHPDAESRFVNKIRAADFPFIVLSVSFDQIGRSDPDALAPQIGLDGAEALAIRYELAMQSGIYLVYRVKTPGAQVGTVPVQSPVPRHSDF
jgi:hypothetical protein